MIWIVAYAVVAIFLLVPLDRLILSTETFEDPDRDDRAMAWTFALCLCLFWPAVVIGVLAVKCSQAIWNRITPREDAHR